MGKLKDLFEEWWNKASDEDKQHYYDELKHFNEDSISEYDVHSLDDEFIEKKIR